MEGKARKYAASERKYMIAAITTTMSKFGPSGSLKSANIVREHTRDVSPRIINETFFDLKYMFVIILENLHVRYRVCKRQKWKKSVKKGNIRALLPGRLMVGREPLKLAILVRIQARQQPCETDRDAENR